MPYKFESDEEVYQSVNGFLDNISSKHIVERLRKIGDNYNGYNLDKIYIVSKFYESVSQKTYRDWETINTALEIHYNNILPGNGKSKADKVKKAVKNDLQKSITEINELVSNYKLCPDDNIKAETYIHEISHILNNFEAQELKYNPEIHLVESELKASELKNVLDVIMNAFHWCSVFMTEELVDKDNNFYAELEEIYDEIYPVISLYNLVRNYVTQKPYSTKKIKLNFGIPTLADGWSKSKEYSNNAIILMRDNLYYLGIFNAKNKPDKKIIEGNTSENKGDYKKMIYNLLPGPNKMIPWVFLSSKKGMETYKPSAYILEGYKQNKHLKSSKDFDITFCHDLIDYFKNCIAIHPEWKNLSTKGVEIPQEEIQKRNGISILSFIIVIVGFFMLYRPAPKTDVGTEVIKTNSEIQSVPESSTEKESSTVSNLTPKDVQTLQELKEEIESNAPSDSNSLDINKAKDLAEKAQQQNWLKRGE